MQKGSYKVSSHRRHRRRKVRKRRRIFLAFALTTILGMSLFALVILLITRTDPIAQNNDHSAHTNLSTLDEIDALDGEVLPAPIPPDLEGLHDLAIIPVSAENYNLRDIILRHTKAMGGLANWNDVQSLRLNGQISQGEAIYPIVIIKKRPLQIRTTISIPKDTTSNNFVQVVFASDGKDFWQSTKQNGELLLKKAVDESSSRMLSRDAPVLPILMHAWQANEQLYIKGRVAHEERNILVLGIDAPLSSFNQLFYLDIDSFELCGYRLTCSNFHSEVTLYNYQKIDGLKFPLQSTIHDSRTGISHLLTESVTVGVGIYEEYFKGLQNFEMPSEMSKSPFLHHKEHLHLLD